MLLLASACRQEVAAAPMVAKGPALQPFQEELLRLAFRAASAFPLEPHAKNRSRAQEVAVVGCFELDAPQLALEFAHGIADWRRGSAYADYACYCARHDGREQALDYVKRAETFVKELARDVSTQEWRRDLIMMKLARACMLLGDQERADAFAAGIEAASTHAVDDDWARTAADRANMVAAEKLGEAIATLDASFQGMSLGQQNTAIATLVALHERFFAEAAHRVTIEERLTKTYDKLPPPIRLQALLRLVSTCLAKNDKASALRLLAVARDLAAAHTWRPADQVPQLARLAELRGRAGETAQARADAEAALAIYHEERDRIVNIERAETLWPLALTWHTLGEATTADDLLALALEEAMENPNSRPRADDLVDIAVAMARHGCKPSVRLATRMRQVCEGLGNPW